MVSKMGARYTSKVLTGNEEGGRRKAGCRSSRINDIEIKSKN